ncbi:mucin-2-like isoform X2 [Pungitius pungitius]|uniref:mucin-2-like isoform X2 n=1 Tax=Pungitius pungitius TaxID=134920 RepID=UPI002E0D9659
MPGHPNRVKMLTLTAGLCLIIASLGVPGLARNIPVYKRGYGNPCYGMQDGPYPNPNDPHSYYNCVWGLAYIQKCPLHLVYKHSITTCYYPGSSESSSSSHEDTSEQRHPTKPPIMPTTPPTTTPPATPIETTTNGTYYPGSLCAGRPDGQYTNPNDPHSFLSCVAGQTYILQCPANLVYVEPTNRCDYPSSPTTNGSLCTGRPDGQYTNPNDPHSFLSCVAGLTYILQCPANLVYVEPTNRCDYPSSPTTNGSLCTGRPDGQYTNPNDPHSFLSCVAGLTYILQCPANLVYVEPTNRCDYPSSPTTNGSLCTGRPDGQYTNPNDPHSFLSCVAGLTYILQCPANLVYVEPTNRCDYPSSPTTNGSLCTGRPDGQYTNPNDPHSFLSCVAGLTYILQCPANLVYVEPTNRCDYPSSPTTNGSLCTGRPDGQYTNPNDPHSFLSCVAGLTYILQCPANLVYVEPTNRCDYPSSPTTNGSLCTGRPDGQYTNPNDPHSFLSCVAGLTYILQCPANLVYVEPTNRCDYPSSPTTNGSLCTGRPDGQYTNPNDPHSFLSCVAGLTYILQCPANLVYVEPTNRCDYPSSPTTNGSLCTGRPDGQYTNPNDPHSFLSCVAGLTYILQCPANLVYVEPTNRCDYPSSPTTNGSLCTGRPDGQYTNPNDPHSFLSCVAGLTYILQCPANLVYVEPTNRCDYPSSPTTNGSLCTGRPDGQYTNPNDPHSFLSCVAGLTYILQCPANLVYVEPTNRCDYPSSPTTNGSLCTGRPDGQYTNPNDPHSFLSCVAGLTYILQCPANLVYVEPTNRCDYP